MQFGTPGKNYNVYWIKKLPKAVGTSRTSSAMLATGDTSSAGSKVASSGILVPRNSLFASNMTVLMELCIEPFCVHRTTSLIYE